MMEPFNLDAEAQLDPAIQPAAGDIDVSRPPETIFLTGVTGFVAAYILAELVNKTPAKIYALVRAATIAEGMERIRHNLMQYALWDAALEERIVPVPGDLKLPFLGLSADDFDWLAQNIDTIFHVGSKLSYIAPYAHLKAANVGGTQETLRLATRHRPKPFHFVSSLGIMLGFQQDTPLAGGQEDDALDAHKCPDVGYFQTKYVAEALVRVARSRGIPVTIHRIGLIVGDSQRGCSNIDDFVARMIPGCIQAGYGPEVHHAMDMTPVDYVAQAIVYLAFQPAALGGVFHLLNPQPITWSGIMDTVIEAGFPVTKLPFRQWVDAIEAYENPETNPLHPLLPFFHIPFAARMLGISETAYHALGTNRTLLALRHSGITCPPVDRTLLLTFLQHFMKSGRIKPLGEKV